MKSFSQLKSELDANKVKNLYIFTGEEKEVMKKYIKRIGNPIEVESFKTLWNRLMTKGLFQSSYTYIMYNDKEVQEMSVEILLKQIGNNTLILVFDSIDKRKKFFKETDKYITEFEKFTDSQLVGYIQKLIDIPSDIAQVLARYCNNEVSRIELEVDKLKHLNFQHIPYAEDLTLDLLNELITPPAEDRIFDMVDAVARKQKKRAFELYSDLLELQESPIKIVSLLYTKFKQVFLTQTYFMMNDYELAQKTGMNAYQVKFVRELVGAFSLDKLIEMLRNIQETEVAMKTGQRDINQAMDVLLIDILS